MKPYEEMSDDDLRVAMAEAMGFKITFDKGGVTLSPPRSRDEGWVLLKDYPNWMEELELPDPLSNANDLREFVRWVEETVPVYHFEQVRQGKWHRAEFIARDPMSDPRFSAVCKHDGTRPGIDVAEGRAIGIAGLQAIAAKKGAAV